MVWFHPLPLQTIDFLNNAVAGNSFLCHSCESYTLSRTNTRTSKLIGNNWACRRAVFSKQAFYISPAMYKKYVWLMPRPPKSLLTKDPSEIPASKVLPTMLTSRFALVENQENIKRLAAGSISLFVHKLSQHGIQRHFVFYHYFCPPARCNWCIIKVCPPKNIHHHLVRELPPTFVFKLTT